MKSYFACVCLSVDRLREFGVWGVVRVSGERKARSRASSQAQRTTGHTKYAKSTGMAIRFCILQRQQQQARVRIVQSVMNDI